MTAIPVTDTASIIPPDIDTAQLAIRYLTIADTGQSYQQLRDKMFALYKTLHWPIDTMNRYYNPTKNEIVVNGDDDDEIYRGEYFPRRYTSENMSLEYYNTYSENSTRENLALVTGIYEKKASADSLLAILLHYTDHPFVLKARIYTGCMH